MIGGVRQGRSAANGRSEARRASPAWWIALTWILAWSLAPIAHAGAPDPLRDVVQSLADDDAPAALAQLEALDAELKAVPRIAYLHARLLDTSGRRGDALAILTALQASAHGLPEPVAKDIARRIAQWQAALAPAGQNGAPAQRAPRTAQEKLERAERWLNAGREQAAADLLRGTPPRSLRARWYHVRGLALFRMRNHYDEAARVLALGAAIKSDTQDFDAFHAARALARADQNSRAVVDLRKFARRFPTSRFAAEAMYLAAWLELRMGRSSALASMERFAHGPLARGEAAWKQEALWTLGYYAYAHGKLKDAERALTEAAAAASDQMAQGAANYWAARAKHDGGDRDGAIALWTALIARDPFHWYALLSRARLVDIGVTPDPIAPSASASNTPAELPPPLPADVAFYAGIGLFADASTALQAQESSVRSATPPDQSLPTLVRAYHALHDHARPYHLTIAAHADALMTAWTPATDWIWRTTMATPHRAIVDREASAHGVEPAFVYAIMRKESAFDPSVVSYADALGLMQLLHGTAIKVARALGDTVPSRADMFRPAINIRLGTALLSQLRKELGSEPAFAMAGYNAGAHRVHQWRKSVSAEELDRFVEEIPIEQTRNYVRRVYANWARYRYLLEPDREPITITLPLSTSESRQ